MKKSLVNIINIFITFVGCSYFYSCAEEGPSVSNTPGNPLKGVYILYQDSVMNADYAYFDVTNAGITNNVFRNSNNGSTLSPVPGDMRLYNNRDLFITCRGSGPSNGGIFKINAETNLLINSLQFGHNPGGFTIDNNQIFVANTGSDYVTKLNTDFNIIHDSINVGFMPANILYGFNQYVVSKSSITNEQSLAIINETNYSVRKIFLNYIPVSSAYNINGYFISGYANKTIYRFEPEEFVKVDSIIIPTQFGYIGEIFREKATSFLVIAGNKEIWELSVGSNGQLSANIKISNSSTMTISGAAYEETRNEIFIADNNEGVINGELHIFDAINGQIKSTHQLGGKNPVKLAFRY